jgi:hypothetical protein
MSRTISIVSSLEGATTHARGRFLLSGPAFQIVSDGSIRSGGQGEAIGSLDLLVASLVSCALNSLRVPDVAGDPDRHVEVLARVERDDDDDVIGTLILECFIGDVDDSRALELVEEYRERCRIYVALKDSLDIRIVAHGVPSDEGNVLS